MYPCTQGIENKGCLASDVFSTRRFLNLKPDTLHHQNSYFFFTFFVFFSFFFKQIDIFGTSVQTMIQQGRFCLPSARRISKIHSFRVVRFIRNHSHCFFFLFVFWEEEEEGEVEERWKRVRDSWYCHSMIKRKILFVSRG